MIYIKFRNIFLFIFDCRIYTVIYNSVVGHKLVFFHLFVGFKPVIYIKFRYIFLLIFDCRIYTVIYNSVVGHKLVFFIYLWDLSL